jgi:hypothetical protein
MTKISALEKQTDTKLAYMQIVYLHHYEFPYDKIAEITGYAKSTVKNYVRKFADLLEEAKKTFYHITQKITKEVFGKRQLVYLFKFYDEKNELVCSKVGTTTRLPQQRLKEEIKYYQNHDIPVTKAEICSVIDCGDIPAEGAESVTRAYYIRRHPKTFCKNDRFFNLDIAPRTFNKIVNNYLENTEEIA